MNAYPRKDTPTTVMVIQKMEQRGVLPPGIGWHQSSPPTSGSQPLELVYNAVIQSSSDSILLVDNVFDPGMV